MHVFIFTEKSKKEYFKLDEKIQVQIREKLEFLKSISKIETSLKQLKNLNPATHRLRVGSFRLILKRESSEVWVVLKIGHRREVYN